MCRKLSTVGTVFPAGGTSSYSGAWILSVLGEGMNVSCARWLGSPYRQNKNAQSYIATFVTHPIMRMTHAIQTRRYTLAHVYHRAHQLAAGKAVGNGFFAETSRINEDEAHNRWAVKTLLYTVIQEIPCSNLREGLGYSIPGGRALGYRAWGIECRLKVVQPWAPIP